MVVNILKDGTRTDVSEIRISKEEFPTVYKIAEGINDRWNYSNTKKKH